MAPISLLNLLKTHVASQLEQFGYGQNRRTFMKAGQHSELAVIEAIQETGVLPVVFVMRCGLALPRNRLQESGQAPVAPNGSADVAWGFDLLPPSGFSDRRFRDSPYEPQWAFDPDDKSDAIALGNGLADALRSVAVPLLDKALEGERRVDELETAGVSTMQWRAPFTPPSSASEGGSPWS